MPANPLDSPVLKGCTWQTGASGTSAENMTVCIARGFSDIDFTQIKAQISLQLLRESRGNANP